MHIKRTFLTTSLVIVGIFGGLVAGWFARGTYRNDPLFFSPFIEQYTGPKEKPLQKYSFLELSKKEIKPGQLTILSELSDSAEFTAYEFSYEATGGTMTGQLNIPQTLRESKSAAPAIIMLRGYYPIESYTTGGGTRNGAAALAKAGYITVAPDFLGYGGSDPEFENSWEARFARPLQVIELLSILETNGVPVLDEQAGQSVILPTQVGLWGHSNGGYIALSVLQILSRDIPTTLWAPVTAPFPYSVLYYGLEQPDEGKAQRKWLALLEEDYDVFDFSISKHMDRLTGPIQLHHGISDPIAPITWSDAFRDTVTVENERRVEVAIAEIQQQKSVVTESGLIENTEAESRLLQLPPIELLYFRYSNTDHNMQPSWNTVMQRDLEFFAKEFSK